MAEENTARDIDDDSDLSAEELADSDNAKDESEAAVESSKSENPDVADKDEGIEPEDTVVPDANAEMAAQNGIGDEVSVIEPPTISSPMGSATPVADLSMILDIPVTLSMEIGQTRISINELLKLGKDSVIELQRMADEPLDVLVNGTLVAHGEAVVVGDRFGIRLTDVISPQERLSKVT